MKRFINTIAGQIILLTLGAVFLSEFMVIGILLLTKQRVAVVMETKNHEIKKIMEVYKTLKISSKQNRNTLLTLSSNSDIRFSITEEKIGQNDVSGLEEFTTLKNRLEVQSVYKTEKVVSLDTAWYFWFSEKSKKCAMLVPGEIVNQKCPHIKISVPLNESEWFNFETITKSRGLLVMLPVLISTIIIFSGILIVVFYVVHRITLPLKSLSNAAVKLGCGEQIRLIEAKGPTEISTTIEAFNVMQERLTRFVEGRTQLLASISHDLRTPITSLRLRAEFIEDEELRSKIVATLEEMQTMVAACLRFSSQDINQEKYTTINLVEILADLAGEIPQISLSMNVSACNFAGRPISLRRAIRNVLENGVHYGERVDMSMEILKKHAIISIHDQGPGVPEDQLDNIFEPFIRLDKERNTESGNVGLGLSISKSIIQNHGGTIHAENTATGLKVSILLPLT